MNERRERISWWMGGLMIMTAAIIDLVQFLLTFIAIGLVASPIITVGSVMLFWLWSKILGISFFSNPKQLATFTAECLGELIPAVDALPLWTIGTIALVIITRSEDKGGLLGKAAGLASPLMNNGKVISGGTTPNIQRLQPSSVQPLNKNVSQRPQYKSKVSEIKKPKEDSADSFGSVKKTPDGDWKRDKSVDEAMKLRQQRMEVAERLGMDKDKAAKHILNLEDKEHGRAA